MKATRKPSFSARGGWKDSAASDFSGARISVWRHWFLEEAGLLQWGRLTVREILGNDWLSKKSVETRVLLTWLHSDRESDPVFNEESESKFKKAIAWRLFMRMLSIMHPYARLWFPKLRKRLAIGPNRKAAENLECFLYSGESFFLKDFLSLLL